MLYGSKESIMAATTQVNSPASSSDRLTEMLKKAGASDVVLDILAGRFELKLPPLSDFTGSTVTPPASRTAPANNDPFDPLKTPAKVSIDPPSPSHASPTPAPATPTNAPAQAAQQNPSAAQPAGTAPNAPVAGPSEEKQAPQKSSLLSWFRTKTAIVIAGVGLLVGGYFYSKGRNQQQTEGSTKAVATNVVDGAKTTNAPFTLLSTSNLTSLSPSNQLTLSPLPGTAATNSAAQGGATNSAPKIPDTAAATNAASAAVTTATNSTPSVTTTNSSPEKVVGDTVTNNLTSGIFDIFDGPLSFLKPATPSVGIRPPLAIPGLNTAATNQPPESIPSVNPPTPGKTNAPSASTSAEPALRTDFSSMPLNELRDLAKRYQNEAVKALKAGKPETEAIAIAAKLAKDEGNNIDALTGEYARRTKSQSASPTPTASTASKPLVTDFSAWPTNDLYHLAAKYKAEALKVITAGGKESDALTAAATLAASEGNNIDSLTQEIHRRNLASKNPSPAPSPAPTSPTDYKAMSTDQLREIFTPYFNYANQLVASGKTPEQAQTETEEFAKKKGVDFPALVAECMKRQNEPQSGPQQTAPAAPQPSAGQPPVSAPAATNAPATLSADPRITYQPRAIPVPSERMNVTPIEQRITNMVVPFGSPRDMSNFPERYKPRPIDLTPKFSGKQADLKQLYDVRTAYVDAAKKSGEVNPQDSQGVWHKAVELAAKDGTDLNAVSLNLAAGQLHNSTSARRALKTTDPMVPTDKGGLQWVGQKKFGGGYDSILSEDGSVVVDQRRAKFLGIPLPWKRTIVADGVDKKEAKALLASMKGQSKEQGGI